MPKRKKGKIEWGNAPDIKERIDYLIDTLDISWVKKERIFTFRSQYANTRAYARIWGLSRIWQEALSILPSYCIEVISEKFDRLPQKDRDKILLHEIAHIPRNFSGSLMPHKHGKGNFHDKLHDMIRAYDRL